MAGLDLIGSRYGRLVPLCRAPSRKKLTVWTCQCDCGRIVDVYTCNLRAGLSRSCGCAKSEATRISKTKHGQSKSGNLYSVWCAIKDRCLNPNNPSFPRYGGRGIRICSRWKNSFEAFARDMGKRPSGTSIERKNNNGNYTPKNCIWATCTEQARNRRSNRWVRVGNTTRLISDWIEISGVERSVFYDRLRAGETVADILKRPKRR